MKVIVTIFLVIFIIISSTASFAEEEREAKIGETMMKLGTISDAKLIYSGMIGRDTFVITESLYRNSTQYFLEVSQIPFKIKLGFYRFHIEIIEVKPHKIIYKIIK